MAYYCNKCGYIGETGPEHTRPGLNDPCNYLAGKLDRSLYADPELDDTQREILEAAMVAIDAHYAAALAALPLDEYRVTRARFAAARHQIAKMAVRMQITHKMTDGAYSAFLLSLAQELTISGLQAYPSQDETVRDKVLFKHHMATHARAIRAMLVPQPKRPSGLVDADGKPITKRTKH